MEQENEPVKSESSKLVSILLKSSIAIVIIVFLIFLAFLALPRLPRSPRSPRLLRLPRLYSNPQLPKAMICRSKLKRIALVVILYSHDNDGKFPTPDKWNDLVFDYIENSKELYHCPLVKKQESKTCTYILNENQYDLKGFMSNDTVLAFEGVVGWNQTGGVDAMVYRHGPKKDPSCNVAFADGHVERVKKSEAGNLKWEATVAD